MKGKGETKTKVRRKDLEWENKKIDGNKSHGVTLFLVKGHKKPAVRLTGLIRNSDSKKWAVRVLQVLYRANKKTHQMTLHPFKVFL